MDEEVYLRREGQRSVMGGAGKGRGTRADENKHRETWIARVPLSCLGGVVRDGHR